MSSCPASEPPSGAASDFGSAAQRNVGGKINSTKVISVNCNRRKYQSPLDKQHPPHPSRRRSIYHDRAGTVWNCPPRPGAPQERQTQFEPRPKGECAHGELHRQRGAADQSVQTRVRGPRAGDRAGRLGPMARACPIARSQIPNTCVSCLPSLRVADSSSPPID